MKKLFLSLAVVMSVSLFSCGNGNAAAEADSTAVDSVAADTVELTEVVDSAAADTTVVVAAEEVVNA